MGKPQNNFHSLRMSIFNSIIIALSTFFYVGYLPLIPGTFGSFAAMLFVYLFRGDILSYGLFTLLVILVGLLVAGRAENILNKKDAPCIVIDEVAGVFISFMFVPFDLKLFIIGFIVFRLLDTLKPYPAGYFQRLKGSLGIMGDDLVAAVYTNIILQAVLRFTSLRIS